MKPSSRAISSFNPEAIRLWRKERISIKRWLGYQVPSDLVKHMSKKSKRGRDAGTGEFIPVKTAERRKKTAIVATVKVGPRKKRK